MRRRFRIPEPVRPALVVGKDIKKRLDKEMTARQLLSGVSITTRTAIIEAIAHFVEKEKWECANPDYNVSSEWKSGKTLVYVGMWHDVLFAEIARREDPTDFIPSTGAITEAIRDLLERDEWLIEKGKRPELPSVYTEKGGNTRKKQGD